VASGSLQDATRRGVVDPQVDDPNGEFVPKEKAIADYLAEHGARVDQRPRDPRSPDSQPDTTVRWSPDDPGAITEFKTLDEATPKALTRNLTKGARQSPDGAVVIDGRKAGLTREVADEGWRRTITQPGRREESKPTVARVILGDGTIVIYRKGAP
jgi:hypothetical protein